MFDKIKTILSLFDEGILVERLKCPDCGGFHHCEKRLAMYLQWHEESISGRVK